MITGPNPKPKVEFTIKDLDFMRWIAKTNFTLKSIEGLDFFKIQQWFLL